MAIVIASSFNERVKFELDKIIEELASQMPQANLLQNLVKQQLATIKQTPNHPVYATMIREAIENLNEELGSTKDAISHFILSNYDVLKISHSPKLTEQLEKLVTKKELEFTSRERYMLVKSVVSPATFKQGGRRLRGQHIWRHYRQRHIQNRDMKVRRIMSRNRDHLQMKDSDVCKEQWLQLAAKLFADPAINGCTDAVEVDEHNHHVTCIGEVAEHNHHVTCIGDSNGETQAHDSAAKGSVEPSELADQVLEGNNINTDFCNRTKSVINELPETGVMGKTTSYCDRIQKMDHGTLAKSLLPLKDMLIGMWDRTKEMEKEQRKLIGYLNALTESNEDAPQTIT